MAGYTKEDNPRSDKRWGCQLPGAGRDSSLADTPEGVLKIQAECNKDDTCVGYYGDRGNWLIATDKDPKDCTNTSDTQYHYFWRKTVASVTIEGGPIMSWRLVLSGVTGEPTVNGEYVEGPPEITGGYKYSYYYRIGDPQVRSSYPNVYIGWSSTGVNYYGVNVTSTKVIQFQGCSQVTGTDGSITLTCGNVKLQLTPPAAAPGPSPVPSPGPSPVPSPGPSPVPSPGPSPVPSPGPSPVPSPGPSPVPSQGPSPGPSPVPSTKPGPSCAAISGALCPVASAIVVSKVRMDFGSDSDSAESYEVSLASNSTGMSGYDGMTGFYVAIASGKVKYAKPGDTKLTEVKLTKKKTAAATAAPATVAPGASVAPAPDTAPTYTNEDGSITMTVTYGKNPLEDSTGTVLMWVGIGLGILVICIILIVVWRASSRNDDGYIRVDEFGDGDTISEPPIRRPWRPRYDNSVFSSTPYQPQWDPVQEVPEAPPVRRFAQDRAPPPLAPLAPQAPQAPPSAQAFGSRHHSRSYGQSRPLRPSRSSLQSHRRI